MTERVMMAETLVCVLMVVSLALYSLWAMERRLRRKLERAMADRLTSLHRTLCRQDVCPHCPIYDAAADSCKGLSGRPRPVAEVRECPLDRWDVRPQT